MPGPQEPQGLGADDTRVHDAWYLMWWRLYVEIPRSILRGRDALRTAKAHRAHLLKHPRL